MHTCSSTTSAAQWASAWGLGTPDIEHGPEFFRRFGPEDRTRQETVGLNYKTIHLVELEGEKLNNKSCSSIEQPVLEIGHSPALGMFKYAG